MWERFEWIDFTAMVLAFALTAGLLWLMQPVARSLGLLDHPAGRKDHAVPTPITGGIAIFIACVVMFVWTGATSPAAYSFLAAAALLIALGVLDDLYDLRWYWRILGQTVAALLIIYWGGVRVEYIGPVFGMSPTALGWLSVPFTVFATVGLINAMNMIDGADGLCGLLGLAALAMLTAAAIYSGNTLLAERLSVLVGALAGFLLWNIRLPWRPRAKVFLGNAGSAMLGLVIAWISFRLTQTPAHPVIPVLALWMLPVPVIDCLVLIVRRLQEGRSPFSAGRDHIHHIMQDAGFGPTRAALHLTWFSLLCGLVAAVLKRMQVPPPLLLLGFVALTVAWYLLSRRRERAVAFFRRLRRAPAAHPAPLAVPDVE
ncbi:MAG: undecaprenyl/decaprenyl-phosphate alpha-N-acetylglucosaminyl 1-phosphate transferase [Thermomonas hydrothermalis]|uniref:MraY family glycosyltransferase n=1 Tax=Thermomonas hydrothermalis TaxID=213588 RepID=UPI0023556C18|nr:MraY family glycosyltransferase [Thermomonas hydrothermalis]MCL6618296.1 undecaprenyl/decaprenyl-phosphate alpha-N-acetylglucosaminyl 1-phosphate transferase [Thermomonas hydrothermalis]